MVAIETRAIRWLGAAAVTVWPIVLLRPGLDPIKQEEILMHERVHGRQQRRWALLGALLGAALWLALVVWPPTTPAAGVAVIWGALEGGFFGLLLWRLCYLLVLPVGWNPFRRRWEMAAYRAQGLKDPVILSMLRRAPYHLWWS